MPWKTDRMGKMKLFWPRFDPGDKGLLLTGDMVGE
jgi:hypothetical protein